MDIVIGDADSKNGCKIFKESLLSQWVLDNGGFRLAWGTKLSSDSSISDSNSQSIDEVAIGYFCDSDSATS